MSAIETLFSLLPSLQEEQQEIIRNLKRADQEVNDCYHALELLPLNAVELSKVTQTLRKALRARRELKEQRSAYQRLESTKCLEYFTSCMLKHVAAKSEREARYKEEARGARKIVET